MQGWIKLHRKIRNHPFFKQKRKFSRFEAWIDLLLEVNHRQEKFLFGNEWVECERGQTITSIRKLSERWGWSKTKVVSFLKLLKDDQMIEFFSDKKRTVLTVLNWDIYQDVEDTKRTQKGHQTDGRRTQIGTNNNDKNDKNDKNEKKVLYAEFVKMTPEEYQKLTDQFGEETTAALIHILDNYKGSTGKKYKSDYRAILSWVVKRYEEDRAKSKKPQNNEPQAWETIRQWAEDKEARERNGL